MNEIPDIWLDWASAFCLVLARIGAAVALLPGVGEVIVLSTAKIGVALCLTLLLLPSLQPLVPPIPESSLHMGLMIAGEVLTGLWFGWLARMISLALPMGAQFIAYLMGISSVLQPDAELGAQSTALASLFELAAPVLVLVSGLYTMPIRALEGMFVLIPPASLLPAADSAELAVSTVLQSFSLALQLAAPFVAAGIVWHIVIGHVARIVPRIQIYFVSVPGQILGGLCLLMLSVKGIIAAWHEGAGVILAVLPGGR